MFVPATICVSVCECVCVCMAVICCTNEWTNERTNPSFVQATMRHVESLVSTTHPFGIYISHPKLQIDKRNHCTIWPLSNTLTSARERERGDETTTNAHTKCYRLHWSEVNWGKTATNEREIRMAGASERRKEMANDDRNSFRVRHCSLFVPQHRICVCTRRPLVLSGRSFVPILIDYKLMVRCDGFIILILVSGVECRVVFLNFSVLFPQLFRFSFFFG